MRWPTTLGTRPAAVTFDKILIHHNVGDLAGLIRHGDFAFGKNTFVTKPLSIGIDQDAPSSNSAFSGCCHVTNSRFIIAWMTNAGTTGNSRPIRRGDHFMILPVNDFACRNSGKIIYGQNYC